MITDSAARQLSLTLPLMARLDLTEEERAELRPRGGSFVAGLVQP